MVEVSLEFTALIVSETLEQQCRGLDLIVLLVVLIQSTIEISGEKLVAYSEERLGIMKWEVSEESIL